MRYYVILLGLFALLVAPATSYAIGIEAGVGGWEQEPSGTIAYKTNDEIDVVDDADFEKEVRYYGRAKLDMPLMIPNFYLVHTPMKFEGTGSISKDFTFGDITYSANADFETDMEINHTDLALYYGLPFLDTATLGVLNAEVGLNIRYIDFSIDLKGTCASAPCTGQSVTESESATLYIPMLYAGVQLAPTEFVALEAEYRGLAFNGDSYTDFIGRLKVKPFGPVFIAAGYRQEQLVIEENDIEIDMGFKGLFLEAGFQF